MLLEALGKQVRERPNAVAIVDDRGTMTWKQLDSRARKLAKVLRGRTKRDKIAILLPSGGGFVTAFYATLYAGKTVVPLNFLLGIKETRHCIDDSGIDLVLTVDLLLKKLDAGKAVVDSGVQILDLLAFKPGLLDIARQALPLPSTRRDPEELAAILYTSGTSGLPKGVELTHGNLQRDAEACIVHVGLDNPKNHTGRAGNEHTFLGIVPLFHSTGLLATLIAPVALGAKMVYTARFSPVGTLKAIRDHNVSVMAAVPSMYNAIARLKEAGPDDMKGMFMPISGGEPLPARIRDAFCNKFGVEIMEGYGLTETCGPICVNHPRAHRPGSVGKPLPDCDIRIESDAAADEPGEILVKGPMVFRGYHHLPDASSAARTDEGYFRSGDLGRFDEEGFLFITGRKKDMLIVSGENVYPREIEEIIGQLPGVDVAAVVGRPDESRGEVPVAFITVAEGQEVTPEAVKKHCRDAGLPNYKVPRDVVVVDALPISPTGKVLKRELAERAATEKTESTGGDQ